MNKKLKKIMNDDGSVNYKELRNTITDEESVDFDDYIKYVGCVMLFIVLMLIGYAYYNYFESLRKDRIFNDCIKIHDVSECYDVIKNSE